MKLVISSALKMAYYFSGNVKRAKKAIEHIRVNAKHQVRQDISQDVFFFNLLLCTDENNVDEMEATLHTIKINCQLNMPQYKFEKEMFAIFSDFAVDKFLHTRK